MSNVIVIGCGRVGSKLANELSVLGHNVCCVDSNANSFKNLGSDFGGQLVKGVGFDEEVLLRAGVNECDILAACTPSDNANLMACEVAKRLYDVERVVARLDNPTRVEVYKELGIDYVCGTNLIANTMLEKVG